MSGGIDRFTCRSGSWCLSEARTPDSFSAEFRRQLAIRNLPRIRFHGLRHGHASHMLRQGVHPKIVSERLGHGSVGFTLRLDERLVRRAKAYARRSGKSVSQMVAEYFLLLVGPDQETGKKLPPTVRCLRGSLTGSDLDRDDYRKHIEEKHR